MAYRPVCQKSSRDLQARRCNAREGRTARILRIENAENFEDDQFEHHAAQGERQRERKNDVTIPHAVVLTELSHEEHPTANREGDLQHAFDS